MKRIILLVILIIISGIYIQGIRLNENLYVGDSKLNDTLSMSWKEKLTDSCGIPSPAINLALNGFLTLKDEKLLKNDTLLTIIDFSKPSTQKRLFVLDLKNHEIVENTLVAHGINSGLSNPDTFSNRKHSRESSLGFYVTDETYSGKHGYSLRLDGMSKGLNDNARKRAIVIHGADYVSESYIKQNGRIGRSFGCPALPTNQVASVINLIKNGSCLFIYHPSLIPISQTDLEKLP